MGAKYTAGGVVYNCTTGVEEVENIMSKDTKFAKRVEQWYEECIALQTRKRNDYTAALDPFYNYTRSGDVMGVSAGLSMLGRLEEKVVRLSLALRGNKLQVNETLQD